ncbi:MAG: type 1 glutamine amidotransferase [Candidatus Zixiibacteriota bacterium]
MNVLLIHNCITEGFGLYETILRPIASKVKAIHPYRGDLFPNVHGIDTVIVGGTPISAYHLGNHPFLQQEFSFLKEVIAANVPCLGICFGAQLLSLALGGTVIRSPQKEIGVYEAELTESGTTDPSLKGFPRRFPVFQWHQDTFSVPPNAELLVTGRTCRNQMFRAGNAVGVQFHLETGSKEADSWCTAYAEELQSFGKRRDDISVECEAAEKQMALLAERMITNFSSLCIFPHRGGNLSRPEL